MCLRTTDLSALIYAKGIYRQLLLTRLPKPLPRPFSKWPTSARSYVGHASFFSRRRFPSLSPPQTPELRFQQYRSNPLGLGTLSGVAEYTHLSRTGPGSDPARGGEDRDALRYVINPSGLLTIRGHRKGHVRIQKLRCGGNDPCQPLLYRQRNSFSASVKHSTSHAPNTPIWGAT
jgi:hypothetical protein